MYKLLMHALDQEKEAFYDYMELYESCAHEAHKKIYSDIAKDELTHYEHLMAILWEDKEILTDMERALHDMLDCEHHKMEHKLHNLK